MHKVAHCSILTSTKNWKQANYSTTGGWLNKLYPQDVMLCNYFLKLQDTLKYTQYIKWKKQDTKQYNSISLIYSFNIFIENILKQTTENVKKYFSSLWIKIIFVFLCVFSPIFHKKKYVTPLISKKFIKKIIGARNKWHAYHPPPHKTPICGGHFYLKNNLFFFLSKFLTEREREWELTFLREKNENPKS